MTDDQITAALDQLAAQREQITRLDTREATHYATLTGLLAGLTARTGPDPARDDPGGYQPDPAPCWWQLSPDDRQRAGRPAARLGGPGLPARLRPPGRRPRPLLARPRPVPVRPGHRLPACGRCCTSSPAATTALLSAQAEYQARILPALAAQLAAETTRCGHTRPRSTP